MPPQSSRKARKSSRLPVPLRLPQACLRADRASTYAGLDVDLSTALRQEFAGGVAVLGDGVEGAMRFAAGEGRHGAPGAG